MLPIELYCFFFIMSTFLKASEQYENLAVGKQVAISQRYNYKDFDPSLAVDGDDSTDLLKCTLTASGQKEAWLTVDLLEVKNIASISFLHGGLGFNASAMNPTDSGVYPTINGNGTLRMGPKMENVTICPGLLDEQSTNVICLNWGYLPYDSNRYLIPTTDTMLKFYSTRYRCEGNEARLKDCKTSTLSACPISNKEMFISCKMGNTLAGFSVYVSDTVDWKLGTLCYQHDMAEPIDNSINVDCFTTGRYVTIYNSRNDSAHPFLSDFAFINMCEFNVSGCSIGYYGEHCTKCPKHCINGICQMQLGHCFDCKEGYRGQSCEKECNKGHYGRHCTFHCGSCLNQETCNHVNGSCINGCSPGWKGDYCDQKCESGYFGLDCNSTCNNTNCLNSTSCEAASGQCAVDCKIGWAGSFCEECAPTYYGELCSNSCSEFCKNRLCNQSTGHCLSCIGTRHGVICETENSPNTAAVTFDANIGFIATSVILSILVIGIIVYISNRRCCPSSENSPAQTYELPIHSKSTDEYAEIQSKRVVGNIDNSSSEYSEMGMVVDSMFQTAYANMTPH